MSLVVEWHHHDSSCPPLVFIQDMLSGASKGSQMNQIVFPDIFDLEKTKIWPISAKLGAILEKSEIQNFTSTKSINY